MGGDGTSSDVIGFFFAGDVMTGRGIDQVLLHPGKRLVAVGGCLTMFPFYGTNIFDVQAAQVAHDIVRHQTITIDVGHWRSWAPNSSVSVKGTMTMTTSAR